MTEWLGDIFQAKGAEPRPQLFEGTVANSPATATSPLEVRITRFDGGRARWPVQGWTPRGTALPSRGDRCLVAVSDRGGMWCLVWMPS